MTTLTGSRRMLIPRQPSVRNTAWGDDELRRARLGRPELVVEDAGNVIFGVPQEHRLKLNYGFAGVEALRSRFGPLFERLVAQGRVRDRFVRLEIDFTDAPRRPYVEPVLRHHGFEAVGDWLRLTCVDLTALEGSGDDDPNVTVRPATRDDVDAAAALFSEPLADAVDIRSLLSTEADPGLRVTVATDGAGSMVGAVAAEVSTHGVGTVRALGVAAEAQGRGVARALLRDVLGWLERHGTRRVETIIPTGNDRALHLFRGAGFTPQGAGLTYRRDLSPESREESTS